MNLTILTVGWNKKQKIFFIVKTSLLESKADLSTRLCLQPVVMCGVVKRMYAQNPFLSTIQRREVLEIESAKVISLIER